MTAVSVLAAGRATDVLVLLGVVVGAVLALSGLAMFDPRARQRLPEAVRERASTAVAVGTLVAGLVVIGVALG